MLKKSLVAVAFAAPLLLVSMADQAPLDAQSGAGVVINEFRVRGPNGGYSGTVTGNQNVHNGHYRRRRPGADARR